MATGEQGSGLSNRVLPLATDLIAAGLLRVAIYSMGADTMLKYEQLRGQGKNELLPLLHPSQTDTH